MNADPSEPICRSCSGPLQIIDRDDISVTVACAECADTYQIDSDPDLDRLDDPIDHHFVEANHGSER